MGIGGGAILIPALVMFAKCNQHTAQGINLIYFVPTAIIALIIHIRNRMVDVKPAVFLVLTGLIGAFAGAKTALVLESAVLRRIFGIFLLIVGLNEILRKGKQFNKKF